LLALVLTMLIAATLGACGAKLSEQKGAPFNLDGAVRGEAAGVHGTLQNVTATTYQHFPARGARITALSNGSPATVFERTILANGEAFDLQFVEAGSDVKTPPASYTTFLAALKIT